MADDTAARAIATTPEILEMIILQLPLSQILHAQKVSRTWRDVIANSPQLQRALFFKPSAELSIRCLEDVPGGWVLDCLDHTQCDKEQGEDVPEGGPNRWARDKKDATQRGNIILNPLIAAHVPWLLCEAIANLDSGGRKDWTIVKGLRPEASWRKMLLTQPALSEVAVDMGGASHWHRVETCEGDAGITLGALHKRAEIFGHPIKGMMGWYFAFRALERPSAWRSTKLSGADVLDEMAQPSEVNFFHRAENNWNHGDNDDG